MSRLPFLTHFSSETGPFKTLVLGKCAVRTLTLTSLDEKERWEDYV